MQLRAPVVIEVQAPLALQLQGPRRDEQAAVVTLPTASDVLTLRVFSERYAERLGKPLSANDQGCLKQLLEHDGLGETPLTEDAVEAFFAKLRTAGKAASTRNKHVQATTRMFRWAVRKGYLARSRSRTPIPSGARSTRSGIDAWRPVRRAPCSQRCRASPAAHHRGNRDRVPSWRAPQPHLGQRQHRAPGDHHPRRALQDADVLCAAGVWPAARHPGDGEAGPGGGGVRAGGLRVRRCGWRARWELQALVGDGRGEGDGAHTRVDVAERSHRCIKSRLRRRGSALP